MLVKNFHNNKDEFSSRFLPKNSVINKKSQNEQFIDAFISKNSNNPFLQKIRNRIFGLAIKRCNSYNLNAANRADDITQNCMLKLFRFCDKENALCRLNGKDGTRVWQQYVVTVVDNHMIDLYHKNKKMPVDILDLNDRKSPKTTSLLDKDKVTFIWQKISTLPLNEQFLLRKTIEGFKPHEISKQKWSELAKELHISLSELTEKQQDFVVEIQRFNNKIKKQISRAKINLAKALFN